MITLVALCLLVVIIVSGAAVRLTDSGMGCPTWPTCEDGSLVPRGATGHHGWVEFLNRVFTGAVSLAVAAAVLASRRRSPRRADLERWSWGLVAGVFAQALLGGLVVWLHVAPVAVAGHYLLSAVLVWNAVVLHHKAGQPAGPPRPAATPQLLSWSRRLVVVGGLVLVTGTLVTGSGPHSGDDTADRLPFAVTTVARIHSVTVWVLLIVALVVLRHVARGDAGSEAAAPARVLTGLVLAQGLLGYVQYAADVPELLVGAHVLGSALVWVAVVRLHLALTHPDPTEASPVSPGAAVVAAP